MYILHLPHRRLCAWPDNLKVTRVWQSGMADIPHRHSSSGVNSRRQPSLCPQLSQPPPGNQTESLLLWGQAGWSPSPPTCIHWPLSALCPSQLSAVLSSVSLEKSQPHHHFLTMCLHHLKATEISKRSQNNNNKKTTLSKTSIHAFNTLPSIACD